MYVFQTLKKEISDFATKPEHEDAQASIVFIIGHGGTLSENMTGVSMQSVDVVYGTDFRGVEINWIISCFDNVRCEMLRNKPKLFFVAACRGSKFGTK